MNANELADGIENCTTDPLHKQAATMLRQQQAKLTKYELRHAEQRKRIDELEKQLAFMEGEYPEPTIMAKMMEVDLVRQQQAEIEALKDRGNDLFISNQKLRDELNYLKIKFTGGL